MGAIWTYLGREDKEFVSWVEKLDKKSLHVNDQWDLYILAEYFTVNTFTTVGYGDMSAKGMNERVLVMHYQVNKNNLIAIIAFLVPRYYHGSPFPYSVQTLHEQ